MDYGFPVCFFSIESSVYFLYRDYLGFIIGGKDAKTDEFKSFISLRDPLNRPVGGGVILSPNWILTVRHELWKSKSDGKFQPNQDVTIFPMYSNNYADYRGKKFYNISQLYCHSWPDDEPQSYSDLGLIKLYENIPIGDQNGFKAIRIADQEDLQSQSNVQFKVAGWGREYRGPFRFDRPLLSKTLKTITINLEPDNMCSDTLDEYKTPNFFCAGSHNQTICFADSGAPAITTSAITGEEIVAGLASFGTPNCW